MFEIILWKMPIGSKVMENKPVKKNFALSDSQTTLPHAS